MEWIVALFFIGMIVALMVWTEIIYAEEESERDVVRRQRAQDREAIYERAFHAARVVNPAPRTAQAPDVWIWTPARAKA